MIKKQLISNQKQYVLNITNDGAILTYIHKNSAQNAWLAKGEANIAIKTLEKGLKADTQAPISILIDNLNQDYKITNIPKTNIIEKKKIVERKLKATFNEGDMSIALSLNKKNNATDEYLFVNLPNPENINKWIEIIKNFPNPLSGVFLLPIEAASLISNIEKNNKNSWKILVGKSALGSYRFTVTRDDKTVFSRMSATQKTKDPQIIIDDIKKGLQSTLAYIRRINFTNNDKIDLFIIDTPEISNNINKNDFDFARKVEILTLPQIAKKLKLGKVGKETPAFCDMLYATWLASGNSMRKKIVTKLDANQIKSTLLIYKKSLSILTTAIFAVLMTMNINNLLEYKQKIEIEKKSIPQLEKTLQETKAQESRLKYSVKEVKETLSYVDNMSFDYIFSFNQIHEKISQAFEKKQTVFKNVAIDKLTIIPKEVTKNLKSETSHELKIAIVFPDYTLSSQEALKISNNILEIFETEFKNCNVRISKLPNDIQNKGNIKTSRYETIFLFEPKNKNAYKITDKGDNNEK